MASGKEQSKKSQEMAAHMKAIGIWHGRRMTSPKHNNMPVNETGSAAYRRLQKAKLSRNAG